MKSWRQRCRQRSSPVHGQTSCEGSSTPLARVSARISSSVSRRLRAADLTNPGPLRQRQQGRPC